MSQAPDPPGEGPDPPASNRAAAEPPDAIALAERVLAILEEGSFSATYKFALFTALLDLCIEKTTRDGLPPSSITTRQLAEKVVELYWHHVGPFRASVGDPAPRLLRQGGVKPAQQAEILREIDRARGLCRHDRADTPFRMRQLRPDDYRRLVDSVEWKLIEMPIPRLQVLGRQEERFLYEYNWTQAIRRLEVAAYQRDGAQDSDDGLFGPSSTFDNRLLLRPGVAEHLVRLNGVLRPLFRREWTLMVAGMNGLPEAELERFLFGIDRVSLQVVRGDLRDLQNGRCFYCGGRLNAGADVDHFLPWARYADNGLDNLVAAHPKCNNSKCDFLASAGHVEHWRARSRDRDADLLAIAERATWPRDGDRTLSVARALYLRLPASMRLWQAPSEFEWMDRQRIGAALA